MADPAAQHCPLPLIHPRPYYAPYSNQKGEKKGQREREQHTHKDQVVTRESHRGEKVARPVANHLAQMPIDKPPPVILLHRRMENRNENSHNQEPLFRGKPQPLRFLNKIMAVLSDDLSDRRENQDPPCQHDTKPTQDPCDYNRSP